MGHVNHIQSNCRTRFTSLIDMSDVTTANPEERGEQVLRAVLWLPLLSLRWQKLMTKLPPCRVVDEYHDAGIDAFFFDPSEHVAYIVQSKWVKERKWLCGFGFSS